MTMNPPFREAELSAEAATAIWSALQRAHDLGDFRLKVNGTASPEAIALLFAEQDRVLWPLPVLIFADSSQEEAFATAMRFFQPEAQCLSLPEFDVSPYSGLYPNPRVVARRNAWLFHLASPPPATKPSYLTATVTAIGQLCLPKKSLLNSQLKYRKSEELPSNLSETLHRLGYSNTPLVEDVGSFALRGSVVDIFSPAHPWPLRFDLFGDQIESIRHFDPQTQRSFDQDLTTAHIIPAREFILDDESRQRAANAYRRMTLDRDQLSDRDQVLQSLALGHTFPGIDFLMSLFHSEAETPLDYLTAKHLLCWVDPIGIAQTHDRHLETLQREHASNMDSAINPLPAMIYRSMDQWPRPDTSLSLEFSRLAIDDAPDTPRLNSDEVDNGKPPTPSFPSFPVVFPPPTPQSPAGAEAIQRVRNWLQSGDRVLVACGTQAQMARVTSLLDRAEIRHRAYITESAEHQLQQRVENRGNDRSGAGLLEELSPNGSEVALISRPLHESLRIPSAKLVLLRDEDFLGSKHRRRSSATSHQDTYKDVTAHLAFQDLNPGDRVVHMQHGIAVYEGLKRMQVGGIESEFLALSYKDSDKLYLPIYRIGQIQKYSGPGGEAQLDKLGGTGWAKTKIRVRHHLREIASELLRLYAMRSQTQRLPFPHDEKADAEFEAFEATFPYDETDDQLKAIEAILHDLSSEKPMDRLVCGDVGFGKTEVAMRATFKAIQGKRQVAVLAPTTVLSFQHFETFTRRFKDWPVVIRALNRFVPPQQARQTLQDLKEGRVDILIGTHRLLSKDVAFKNLGLLVIDEEQRFGVGHKERIRKLRIGVDTLTLSATPIPRTLNMSLVGIRDLSLINTPPSDRLPTRTFVCKFDEETVRRGILNEIHRGGQVFYLHNRVQSIYSVADELRKLVPEARIRVGHGQMQEHELEETMLAFFNHEIDVLLSTTIIESGIDNPRANTMFIDQAHTFGLSQLYQLRGRVGRSKERAYCYLLIPPNKRLDADAQERLKVIHENTALGSGITIAHHDLELRGAGNLLGEDQSGHVEAVGYETYLELLEETLRELKGEEVTERVDPDINVRIPALIPDQYMPDLRIRLAWYRRFASIQTPEDVDQLEGELRDQFGRPPEEVLNLLGLMLIRSLCRELHIRDLSSGPKAISLAFTEHTPLPPSEIVALAAREKGRVVLTPDMRVNIKLEAITWPKIYDELLALRRLCPSLT